MQGYDVLPNDRISDSYFIDFVDSVTDDIPIGGLSDLTNTRLYVNSLGCIYVTRIVDEFG